MYRQSNLSIFGTHAKQCRNPHPEYGSGTANCNSACYTGNIASTNRGCKCCTHCLERSDSTVRCVTFAENTSKGCFDCIGEFADLKKIGADTKIKTNSENTDHCRNAPDKIIYSCVDGFDYLQHKIPLWKFFWMYVNGTASMSHTLLKWCSQSLFEKSFLQSARPTLWEILQIAFFRYALELHLCEDMTTTAPYLADKICLDLIFRLRNCNTCRFPCFQGFQKPCHIVSK